MEEIKSQKNNQNLEQELKKNASGFKSVLITIGVALVLLISLWIWKNSEIKDVRNNAETEYQVLKEKAKNDIVIARKEQLSLLVKPYVWAVRTEMMKGNLSQINLYALDMVKEKNIMRIAIANDSGIIISSTNKKDEGKYFVSIGDSTALKNNETMIENSGDSVFVVTSPIMGFNRRLGTLFIKYAVQVPDWK